MTVLLVWSHDQSACLLFHFVARQAGRVLAGDLEPRPAVETNCRVPDAHVQRQRVELLLMLSFLSVARAEILSVTCGGELVVGWGLELPSRMVG